MLDPVEQGLEVVPLLQQPPCHGAKKARRTTRCIQHHPIGRTYHQPRAPAVQDQCADLWGRRGRGKHIMVPIDTREAF